ncbi:hypothetical protein ABBQ38_003336 [Trebouxia sp. C0009 RCD-2024]
MPVSLSQALDAEVKRQGISADQIDKLELDQKCRAATIQGLEKFTNLVTLSLGSVNLTSLENFPQLPKLQSLLLTDNRISGGLEALTAAKLDQLTELDLSNNRLASLPAFKPLAGLKSLQALHVQANPAEKSVKGLRQALFTMISALQYVDDIDRFDKERPALEEEDDDGDEYDDEEEDPEEPEDDDSEEANDDAESFEEQGEGAGEGGADEQGGGGFGDNNEDDEDDDDEEDAVGVQYDVEDPEEEEEDGDEDEDEPALGTAYLVGMIPPEIEDDPNEYEDEGESDAPSEDFDDEEDEEGGVAFPEAVRQANKRKRPEDEEDVDEEDDDEADEYDDEDE